MKTLAIALLVILTAGPPIGIGDVRDRIPLPTAKIFERLLESAEIRELDARLVEKSVDLLRPLIEELNLRYSVRIDDDLRSAVADGTREAMLGTLHRLIALAIRSQLDDARRVADDRPEATTRLRRAYVEYLVIDTYVRHVDFDTSKDLRNVFRRANSSAGAAPETFVRLCGQIDSALARLFARVGGSYPTVS